MLKSLVKSVVHQGKGAHASLENSRSTKSPSAQTFAGKDRNVNVLGTVRHHSSQNITGQTHSAPPDARLLNIKSEPIESQENGSSLPSLLQNDLISAQSPDMAGTAGLPRSRKRKPTRRYNGDFILDADDFNFDPSDEQTVKKCNLDDQEANDLLSPSGSNYEQNHKTFKDVGVMCLLIDSASEGRATDNDSALENTGHSETINGTFSTTTMRSYRLTCEHCGIHFEDGVLHSIHMGCHSHTDPFRCNVCGRQCDNKYAFYTHIMRGHQS